MNTLDDCLRYLDGNISFCLDRKDNLPALEQFIQKVRRSTAEMGLSELSRPEPPSPGPHKNPKRQRVDTKTLQCFFPILLKAPKEKEKQRQPPNTWFLVNHPFIGIYNMDTLELRPFSERSIVEVEGQTLVVNEVGEEERFPIRLSKDGIAKLLRMRTQNVVVRSVRCLQLAGVTFTPSFQIWEFLIDFVFSADLILTLRKMEDLWADEALMTAWTLASFYKFEEIWTVLVNEEFASLESPERIFETPSFLRGAAIALFKNDSFLSKVVEGTLASSGFMVRSFLATLMGTAVSRQTATMFSIMYNTAMSKWNDERDALAVVSCALLRGAVLPAANGIILDGSFMMLLCMSQIGLAIDDVLMYETELDRLRRPPLHYVAYSYNYAVLENTLKLWDKVVANLDLVKATAKAQSGPIEQTLSSK